jgi:hypothetical protein
MAKPAEGGLAGFRGGEVQLGGRAGGLVDRGDFLGT